MSGDPAPVRVVFRGYRVAGRKQQEFSGAFPSVNDIGAEGRQAGAPNFKHQKAKAVFSEILGALLREPSGSEYTFIKPDTQSTRVTVPIERDGELPHPMGFVLVEGVCVWPDLGLRDQGNFLTIIAKWVGDVLTAGGWLPHDDWTRFQFGNLERELHRGVPAYTELTFLPRQERLTVPDRSDVGHASGTPAMW